MLALEVNRARFKSHPPIWEWFTGSRRHPALCKNSVQQRVRPTTGRRDLKEITKLPKRKRHGGWRGLQFRSSSWRNPVKSVAVEVTTELSWARLTLLGFKLLIWIPVQVGSLGSCVVIPQNNPKTVQTASFHTELIFPLRRCSPVTGPAVGN